MHCDSGIGTDRRLVSLPEQVEVLRSTGHTDEEIIYKFAIAEVSGGRGTLEDTEAEIIAFPNGLKARALPDALRKARLTVALTRQVHN